MSCQTLNITVKCQAIQKVSFITPYPATLTLAQAYHCHVMADGMFSEKFLKGESVSVRPVI